MDKKQQEKFFAKPRTFSITGKIEGTRHTDALSENLMNIKMEDNCEMEEEMDYLFLAFLHYIVVITYYCANLLQERNHHIYPRF